MEDGYYGNTAKVAECGSLAPSYTPILDQLKRQRQKIQADLDNVDKAIQMLEEHPEFAAFTDIMTKVGKNRY